MKGDHLLEGMMAPSFSVADVDGRLVDIGDFRGKRVLLSFYRFATCPLCNLRVVQFMREYPRFKDNLVVIAVFESSAEYIREYIGPKGLPFYVIPDPERKLFERYGVETSWLKAMKAMLNIGTMMRAMWLSKFRMGPRDGQPHRVPADFLIDEFGRLAINHYGKDVSDHISFREIEQFVY